MANKFERGMFVRVVSHAPFHANRTGVVDFYGTGPSEGTVVLVDPKESDDSKKCLFAVSANHISSYL